MATEDIAVVASSDDAIVAADGTSYTHTGDNIISEVNSVASSRIHGGFRFIVPNVAQGATINADTYMTVHPWGTAVDDPDLDIYAEDADNPATFNGTDRRPYSGDLTLTTASAAWSTFGTGTTAVSPSLQSVIQEIVDRPGWAPGNAIVILFVTRTGGSDGRDFEVRAYDHTGTDEAVLHIDYTNPVDAPVLSTAEVNGSSLVLTYDEALDEASVPAAGDFTVEVDSVAQSDPSAVDVTGAVVTLTLSAAVEFGDTVTVSYTPGGSPIQSDDDGADAASLTDQAVTNNTPEPSNPLDFMMILRGQRARKQ